MKSKDVVIVRDRFLYKAGDGMAQKNGQRFYVKGIAFPDPPALKVVVPENIDSTDENQDANIPPPNLNPGFNYNPTAWIAILQQLRDAVPDKEALNAVRMYQMDPNLDYTEFFMAAADLGFYIMVPLTSIRDDTGAVLNRSLEPPNCYPESLFEYGKKAWLNYGRYPNVLAGVIGNEVMNSMESWYAAPCVKAYARDLQQYMNKFANKVKNHAIATTSTTTENNNDKSSKIAKLYENRTFDNEIMPFPLLYAAQHSGIGAALTETDTIRLTVDYLTCHDEKEKDTATTTTTTTITTAGDSGGNVDEKMEPDINIFGINVESWCSSHETFRYNAKGAIGSYYQLYQGLYNGIDVPLVYSEMGCSHLEFNRDNDEIGAVKKIRDWHQVPVVLHEMNATWSGFCAYAYWGNELFSMTDGGPWDGINPLTPTQDFDNFMTQLLKAANSTSSSPLSSSSSSSMTTMADGIDTKEALQQTGTATISTGTNIFHDLPMVAGGIMDEYYSKFANDPQARPTCSEIENVFQQLGNLKLYDMSKMPMYNVKYDDADEFLEDYVNNNSNYQTSDNNNNNDPMTLSFLQSLAPTRSSTNMPFVEPMNNDNDDESPKVMSTTTNPTTTIGLSMFAVAVVLILSIGMKRFNRKKNRSQYEIIPELTV